MDCTSPTTLPKLENELVYLDHNASSPLRPEVLDAMLPWLRGISGNASSWHAVGRQAREAIELARAEVAALVSGQAADIRFCSGASEADAWAVWGLHKLKPGAVVTSGVEHPAIATAVAELGCRWEHIGVDACGRLLNTDLPDDTTVVALMAANNETGNLYDVASWSQKARKLGAFTHSDLVQAAGKVALDVAALGMDTAALSAHKIGGPQGVGALWIRPGLSLPALIGGGGQEGGLRGGTENVAGIVGFGAAARLARASLTAENARLSLLRDEFAGRLRAELDGVVELGDPTQRLPNTLAFAASGVRGEAVVMRLDAAGIAVSTGSACSTGSGKPSRVLVAMGVPKWQVQGAVRVSLGWNTTADDIDRAGAELVACIRALRQIGGEQAANLESTESGASHV